MSQRIATVTLNPAIDQTLLIPNFAAGAVNRVQASRLDAGGKGINVASFLADAGYRTTATGFLGAENDELFRRLFEQKGIADRCLRIAGQTRIGLKITDPALNQTTDINFPGEPPAPADVARLLEVLRELAPTHEWFVLSGSLPKGLGPALYRQMVAALGARRVVVDTSGAALRAAVEAGPAMIKPNVAELSELTGERLDSDAAVLAAARRLLSAYPIRTVVVSMGAAGAIFVEGAAAYRAVPPAVEVKSTVGAGDAMVAGMVAGKLLNLSLAGCARLATAFSAAAIGQEGHSLPPPAQVEALAARVTVGEL